MKDRASEVYAVLERPVRVWAIAAIHGETMRLTALHDRLAERLHPGDRLVYLGNYLGYGQDVAGTVEELLAFRRDVLTMPGIEPWDVVYLRGAQEEMWHKLLQLQFAPAPRQALGWMLEHGLGATLAAYGASPEIARQRALEGAVAITRWTNQLRAAMHKRAGHDELMAALRRYAVTDNGRLLFVHAGIDPHRPLSEQGDTFWWGSGYMASMSQPFAGFAKIVRGFDRQGGGRRIGEYDICIDGGCGFGGPLFALCIAPSGAILDWLEA